MATSMATSMAQPSDPTLASSAMRPRPRILGLHGKGASGRIMRAQLTSLLRHTVLEDHVEFVDGPFVAPPYHGLEAFFPLDRYTYHAWYHAPSPNVLRAAHSHLQSLLTPPFSRRGSLEDTPAAVPATLQSWSALTSEAIQQKQSEHQLAMAVGPTPPVTMPSSNVISRASSVPTNQANSSRPDTPSGTEDSSLRATPARSPALSTASSMTRLKKRVSFCPLPDKYTTGPDKRHTPASPEIARQAAAMLRPALVLPSNSAVGQSFLPVEDPYDGLICFSQGCAIAAGYLLQRAAAETLGMSCTMRSGPIPKFVIFICTSTAKISWAFRMLWKQLTDSAGFPGGSRPFSLRGGSQYAHAKGGEVPFRLPGHLISIPTLHLLGRMDKAKEEGHLLASLCDVRTSEIIEFDGGHAPPRKQLDLSIIGPAVQRLLNRAGCAPDSSQ